MESKKKALGKGLEQLFSNSVIDFDNFERDIVEENNKETLAQVFTDVRYTKEACEHFSKIYFDFIKKQGF